MNNKELLLTFLGIVILSILGVFFLNKEKDYTFKYDVNDYEIKETYLKDHKTYHFELNVDDIDFDIAIISDYKNKKQVNKVDVYSEENITCIDLQGRKLEFYPVCYDGKEYIDASIVDIEIPFDKKEVEQREAEIDNIKFSNTMGYNYAVWNHQGYYYINDLKSEKNDIFEKEEYYNTHSYIMDKYVITPNYDDEYNFTSIYIYNLEKNKLDKMETEFEISYNFYYMGEHDGKLYLLDRKNKNEYELNPKKKKIEIISKNGEGKVWNGKWEEMSITKLCNTDYIFEKNEPYKYEIKNNTLYLNYADKDIKIKVSKQKVTNIVSIKGDTVFYLVKNKLYLYSPYYKEVELAEYSEWEFNNLNAIFIY